MLALLATFAAMLSISACDLVAHLFPSKAQKGQIEMVRADNSESMMDAAKLDAIVITVTQNGVVYLGHERVDPSQLEGMVRDRLADRVDKTIYLLADARAPYRAVEQVVDEARAAGVDVAGLLTQKKGGAYNQKYSACCEAPRIAMGLEVIIPSSSMRQSIRTMEQNPNESRPIVLQVLYHTGAPPAYKINVDDVQKTELLSKLNAIYQTRAERILFIKADDDINFSVVAEMIDIARSAGVDHVALLTPATTASQ